MDEYEEDTIGMQGVQQSVCLLSITLSSARKRADLGIKATPKHNELVEKPATLCFESFNKAHKRLKRCLLAWLA